MSLAPVRLFGDLVFNTVLFYLFYFVFTFHMYLLLFTPSELSCFMIFQQDR